MVITWEQPWYQKTNSLTRPVKEEEDAESERKTYRTDSFTQEESRVMQKNWNRLRKVSKLLYIISVSFFYCLIT